MKKFTLLFALFITINVFSQALVYENTYIKAQTFKPMMTTSKMYFQTPINND